MIDVSMRGGCGHADMTRVFLNLTAFTMFFLSTATFTCPQRSETLGAAAMVGQISYPAEAASVWGTQARACVRSSAAVLYTENEIEDLATSGSASIATETHIVRAHGARRGLSVAAIRSAHQGAARSTLLNVGMTAALTHTENGARGVSLLDKIQLGQGTIAVHCGLGLSAEGGSDFTKSEVAIEANFSIDARRAGPSLAFAEEGHEENLARRARGNIWAIAHFARPYVHVPTPGRR